MWFCGKREYPAALRRRRLVFFAVLVVLALDLGPGIGGAALAGKLVMDVSGRARLISGKVKITLTVANQGDEPALDIQAEALADYSLPRSLLVKKTGTGTERGVGPPGPGQRYRPRDLHSGRAGQFQGHPEPSLHRPGRRGIPRRAWSGQPGQGFGRAGYPVGPAAGPAQAVQPGDGTPGGKGPRFRAQGAQRGPARWRVAAGAGPDQDRLL